MVEEVGSGRNMNDILLNVEQELPSGSHRNGQVQWNLFKKYYRQMVISGDCDPAYPAMEYLCDRLELNPEQRYWLAYLYSCTYCAPSAYYLFNEFPDYENVDVPRLQRWWDNNKKSVMFQSDRMKVKNFNMLIKMFESYRAMMGNSQVAVWKDIENVNHNYFVRYNAAYSQMRKLYYFGRFSLFNYLEAVNRLTPTKMDATTLYLPEAESCRNGLCYVCDAQEMLTLHHKPSIKPIDYPFLEGKLSQMYEELKKEQTDIPVSHFSIETALCAFKKLHWNTRYLGYYIDRQQEEISKMQENVPNGVDWSILWDFRREYFDPFWLGEIGGWKGIRQDRMKLFSEGIGLLKPIEKFVPSQYRRKVEFLTLGDIYGQ